MLAFQENLRSEVPDTARFYILGLGGLLDYVYYQNTIKKILDIILKKTLLRHLTILASDRSVIIGTIRTARFINFINVQLHMCILVTSENSPQSF